jgi:hypothetical protein
MAGDQDRAALTGQRAHQVADPAHPVGIEPVDRLVEQQHAGVAEQGRRDAEALFHAERKPLDPFTCDARQSDLLEHVDHPAVADPVGAGQAAQVVERGPARMDGSGIEQSADLVHRLPERGVVAAVDQSLAGVGSVESEQDSHGGGLAGAVRAKEPGHQAGFHLEGQVVEGKCSPISFGQGSYFDHAAQVFARGGSGASEHGLGFRVIPGADACRPASRIVFMACTTSAPCTAG